jgi:hypothetical protein
MHQENGLGDVLYAYAPIKFVDVLFTPIMR